jgi:hypothetical protein
LVVLWPSEVRALVVGKVGIKWERESSGELRYLSDMAEWPDFTVLGKCNLLTWGERREKLILIKSKPNN